MTNRELLKQLLEMHRNLIVCEFRLERAREAAVIQSEQPRVNFMDIHGFVIHCRNGEKLHAIKALRSLAGLPLREAKDAVEGPFLCLFPPRSETE